MFNEALKTITDHFQTRLASFTSDVASHPGRFTEDELKRLLTGKSAVRIAIENTLELNVNGQGIHEAKLLMAAYVICSDNKTGPRHERALELTEAIVTLLPHNRFDLPEQFKPVVPRSISAENLYSGEIDRKGLALWGISWEQRLVN